MVEGNYIRREIFNEFIYGGNDERYTFVPESEIQIDASVSCQETEYSIQLELKEMSLTKSGLSYDSAYTNALKTTDSLRQAVNKMINSKSAYPLQGNRVRDTGTGAKK